MFLLRGLKPMIMHTKKGPDVKRTVDIPGELPNRIFTLIPSSALAILKAAEVPEDVYFICRKFAMIKGQFERSKVEYEDHGTILELCDGRVFARGNNIKGQCGRDDAVFLRRAHWLRIPPVLNIWGGMASWFIQTTHGLYAHGFNPFANLGIGDIDQEWVSVPTRVQIDTPVQCVEVFDNVTFFRTSNGWSAAGWNSHGQLALQKMSKVLVKRPLPVPCSSNVVRWYSSNDSTFAWTRKEPYLLACGKNSNGQLGIGPVTSVPMNLYEFHDDPFSSGDEDETLDTLDDTIHMRMMSDTTDGDDRAVMDLAMKLERSTIRSTEATAQSPVGSSDRHDTEFPDIEDDDMANVYSLTPVQMPEGHVRSIHSAADSTFFMMADDKCYAAGLNHYGQLGGMVDTRQVQSPVLVPYLVEQVISGTYTTIFLTREKELLGCGKNLHGTLPVPGALHPVRMPMQFTLPWPVRELHLCNSLLFAHLHDGTIEVRGDNRTGGLGRTQALGWTPLPELGRVDVFRLTFHYSMTHIATDRGVYGIGPQGVVAHTVESVPVAPWLLESAALTMEEFD